MPPIHDLNPRIVEGLYCEALLLADELRSQIERSSQQAMPAEPSKLDVAARMARCEELAIQLDEPAQQCSPEARVMLSCESLRATTRLMHCIAWLLNQRAYYAGEISMLQLRRHGGLVRQFPQAEASVLDSFPRRLRDLIRESEVLYARILRFDRDWRDERGEAGGAKSMRKVSRFGPSGLFSTAHMASTSADDAEPAKTFSPVAALQAKIAANIKPG